VVALDDAAKKSRLSLAQAEILKSLARDEELWKSGSGKDSETGDQ
jgi:glutamate--cysteine ligase catalytic subunit